MRLAIFDLDGTLTRHDTLVPFLYSYLRRHPARLPRVLAVLPAGMRFAGDRDRGRLKGALIHAVMGGTTAAEVAVIADAFIPALLKRGVHVDGLQALRQHQACGDRCILLSASTDLYVPRIGATLGFDEVICTRLRWEGDRLDGRLSGPNCRGEEKRRRVTELLDKWSPDDTTAYGNATSDLAHMLLCREAFMVNGSAAIRRAARRAGGERTRLKFVNWS
jgi:HAD superfamily hydrolase (TIGR01490 family)